MAYDFFAEQDQEDDAQKQQAETGMVQLGPEGSTLKDNPSPQGAPGAQGTNSGSFTNLNSYLDANKSLGFGGQVAGKVQGAVDEAGQAQKTAESGFKQQADAGSVSFDPSLGEAVKRDATSVVGDQAKFSDFLKARDAEYKGPNALVDTDLFRPTDAAQRKAQEQAGASGSEGGRQALLDQYYGSGNGRFDYTGGQKKLDNLLIQNDPSSREAFAKTQENASKTAQDYEGLRGALTAYAGGKREATGQARAQARGAVGIDDAGNFLATDNVRGNGGAVQDTVEGIDERAAARKAELAGLHGTLDPVTGKGWAKDLTPDQIQRMGIDPNAFGGVDLTPADRAQGSYAKYYQGYKVDPGYLYQQDPGHLNYLNFTADSALNRNTVANQKELAQLNALSQLAGKENSFIGDPTQVGTQETAPLYNYQGSRFQSDVGGARDRFTGELAAIRDKYTNAQAGHQNTVNSGGLGSSDSGGIIDPTKEMAEVNAVRVKYGLPPITV